MSLKNGRNVFRFLDHSSQRKVTRCSPAYIKGSNPRRTRHIVITLDSCFYDDNEWPERSRISVKRRDFLLLSRPPRNNK